MSFCPHCGKDGQVKDTRVRPGWRFRRRHCPTHGDYNTYEISAAEWDRLNERLRLDNAGRRHLLRAVQTINGLLHRDDKYTEDRA